MIKAVAIKEEIFAYPEVAKYLTKNKERLLKMRQRRRSQIGIYMVGLRR